MHVCMRLAMCTCECVRACERVCVCVRACVCEIYEMKEKATCLSIRKSATKGCR